MIVQGSQEWHQMRCGRVTASRVADIIARTKTGWGAGRANYAAELIAERLTNCSAPSFSNAAMQWGTDQEPYARAAYAAKQGVEVAEIAFVIHPEIPMAGASPDGLIGDLGMVELKCPQTATHLDTLQSQTVPGKYVTQMMWQMACTGRQWCDFASFDPRLPPHLQLFVKRVERDTSTILGLESEVTAFIAEIDATLADLATLYGEAA